MRKGNTAKENGMKGKKITHTISLTSEWETRLQKAYSKYDHFRLNRFVSILLCRGLDDLETELKASGVNRVPLVSRALPQKSRLPETGVKGKIIPFPGVSLHDGDQPGGFQNGIDNFLREIGYVE